MASPKHTFLSDFRKFFFRGLAILLPSLVTLALLYWTGSFLLDKVASPINRGVRSLVLVAAPEIVGERSMPEWYVVTDEQVATAMHAQPHPASEAAARKSIRAQQFRAWWTARWYLESIGFVVAIVAVYLAGLGLGNLIGRRFYAQLEGLAVRVPIVKQVYPSVKQVTDFLLREGEHKARLPSGRVVLVEYPRVGIWTIGLMTRESPASVSQRVGLPLCAVFIPHTPTPFTGFLINVPAASLYEVPMTIDEYIKYVVSAGVLISEAQAGEVPAVDSSQMPAGWRGAGAGA